MKSIGSRYAQYINKKYKRTGTLWEGRHKSSLIQSERYLLTCYRYIELNPVRGGMVEWPEEYKWSSYGVNAWGDASWLRAHHEYVCLGNVEVTRTKAYRQLCRYQLSNADIDNVRKSTHYCQPLGDGRFVDFIAQKYGVQAGRMQRGRPKNESVGG